MSKYKHYFFSAFAISLLLLLLFISIFRLVHRSRTIRDDIISDDIVTLSNIFKSVDKKCHIIGFEHDKNYIDFLNVKSFEGSEVGSMNLMYPKEWEGPYLKDNLTIQEKFYNVIYTKDGYFVVPGDGVKLSNGKIIGKDIILDKNANVKSMLNEEGVLLSAGRPLAAYIELTGKRLPPVKDSLVTEDLDLF